MILNFLIILITLLCRKHVLMVILNFWMTLNFISNYWKNFLRQLILHRLVKTILFGWLVFIIFLMQNTIFLHLGVDIWYSFKLHTVFKMHTTFNIYKWLNLSLAGLAIVIVLLLNFLYDLDFALAPFGYLLAFPCYI